MTNPFALHPALDDLRRRNPTIVNIATQERPSPRLFGSSDLPPTTASGNPPSMLARLPWKLRAAAAEADQAEFSRLMNTFGTGDPDADLMAEFEPAASHPRNGEYLRAVSAWASGPSNAGRSGRPRG